MHTGQTVTKLLYLLDASGNPQTYTSAAAFTAAGWALTWYDTTGAALATQPSYTVTPLAGSLGQHIVAYAVPSGVWQAVPTVPSGMTDPGTWGGEGTTYDDDSLGGLIATSQGTPGVQSAADANLGDVVDGDSWNSGTLYIPLGKLSVWGYGFADLGSATISAGFKSQPSDTMTAATCAFGPTATADGAFTVSLDPFPAGMNLTGNDTAKQWYLDVQVKIGGRLITTNRYLLRVVWQRDTVT